MSKIFVSPYSYYGLNRKRNWMKAPDCDCGCGGKMLLCLENDDELFSFCADVLSEHKCSESAIFIVRQDGEMQIAIYNSKDNTVIGAKVKEPSTHAFADYDGTEHLCCYSMLIEQKKGEYLIAE